MKVNVKTSFLMYLPFILFFAIILIWHFMLPRLGDDLAFSNMFHKYNIFSFLVWRYETWTSRLLIEFFLAPLSALPKIIWNFFDSIIFLLMAVLIPKIILNTEKINKKRLVIYNSLSCIMVLIYIFTISNALYSAGYIASTLNYTWPLAFGLLHFYLVKRYIFTENNLSTGRKIVIYLIMGFALIFAINQEIMLVIVSGAYFFIILYCLYNKVKIPNPVFIMLFIIVLEFLSVYLSPGNHARYIVSLSEFPEYYKLTLVNKIDLGTTILLKGIALSYIFSYTLINLFFFGILGTYLYFITKKKISIIISLMPITVIITFWIMSLIGYMPVIEFLIAGVTKSGLLHSNLNHILVISFIYGVIIFSVVYSLIQIYKYKGRKLSFVIFCLLLLGFSSQMMRGFSPNCWGSAQRWEIYYYFFIIVISYILSVDLLESKYENCKNWFMNRKIWKVILNSKTN